MKTILTLVLAAFVCSAAFSQIAGFNTSTLPGGTNNFGPSPLAASVTDPNATVTGFVRGSGVSVTGSGAAKGYGGVAFNYATAADAITGNAFFTTSVTANLGYKASYASIDPFSYRRSGSGAVSALLQYQLGSGAFTDITTVSLASSAAGGATLPAIPLSGIAALQNVPDNITVTFRLVPFGATAPGGTFYIFDVANSTAPDFAINGTVTSSVVAFSRISEFTAAKSGNNTSLNWLLSCTTASLSFELQRSSNNKDFTTFYSETASQQRCGSGFTFTDAHTLNGINYYRLKITDQDGSISYSKIISVKIGGAESIKVVPTVATNEVNVYYTAAKAGSSVWLLYDAAGRAVSKTTYNLVKGQNTIRISVADLQKGTYQISGSVSEGKTETLQIIKQ